MTSPGPAGIGPRPSWSQLPAAAKAFRLAHLAWGVVSLAALAILWHGALTGHRDRRLMASIVWLGVEGGALTLGRGDCPMGGVQRSLGDPVPMFELFLPPRAAKAAVPLLAAMTALGLAGVAVRVAR